MFNLAPGERAKCHVRRFGEADQMASPHNHDTRANLVGAAAQAAQDFPRFDEIDRFADDPAIECNESIGPKHNGAGSCGRNRAGFASGIRSGEFRDREIFAGELGDSGRPNFESISCAAEQFATAR